MFNGIKTLFLDILGVIIPPRAHEKRVANLTLDDLEALRHQDGLPYHDKDVTSLIWELKYRASSRALALAGAYLSEELLGIAEDELGKPLLIPVPMHPERRRERGHNQTELLCEAALKNLGDAYEYSPHALKRVRATAPQQTLARHKRLTNLKNSMVAAEPEKIKGRVCIVVDDVSTTGCNTRGRPERALKKAGGRKSVSDLSRPLVAYSSSISPSLISRALIEPDWRPKAWVRDF